MASENSIWGMETWIRLEILIRMHWRWSRTPKTYCLTMNIEKIVKKQLKLTKSKMLKNSKGKSIKDLTSSLQPSINKKSKIKYLD